MGNVRHFRILRTPGREEKGREGKGRKRYRRSTVQIDSESLIEDPGTPCPEWTRKFPREMGNVDQLRIQKNARKIDLLNAVVQGSKK
jgi:hypothetical protein